METKGEYIRGEVGTLGSDNSMINSQEKIGRDGLEGYGDKG